jgi:hypothetical protein
VNGVFSGVNGFTDSKHTGRNRSGDRSISRRFCFYRSENPILPPRLS